MKSRRAIYAALTVILIAIGVGAYIYIGSGGEVIDSIAVLPFVNADGDPETNNLPSSAPPSMSRTSS